MRERMPPAQRVSINGIQLACYEAGPRSGTPIAGAGHWTQQEKPEEVNRLILDWLDRRFPK
jgi:pimeloyl-ACP methyl ester carboxylesterase